MRGRSPLRAQSWSFGNLREARSVTVAVRDLAQIDQTQDRVTEQLIARHNNSQDFFIRNMAEVLKTATTAQNTLTVLPPRSLLFRSSWGA